MSTSEVCPEELAKLVHHYREALAPDFGCAAESTPEWDAISPSERRRMVAAVRLSLLELAARKTTTLSWVGAPVDPLVGGSEGKECGC